MGLDSCPQVFSLGQKTIRHTRREIGTPSENFSVDNEGRVFILYQFPQNKKERRGVKEFDLTGREVGTWEAMANKYQGFRSMFLSGEKLYLNDDLDNIILVFDKELHLLKEVAIPKTYKGGFDFVGEGMIHGFYAWDPKDSKDRYVFDQEEWEKSGKHDFLDYPKRKIRLRAGWPGNDVSSGPVTIGVYRRSWEAGNNYGQKDIFLFSDSESVSIKDDNHSILAFMDFLYPAGVDSKGNIYVHLITQNLSGSGFIERIIKFNPQGEVLARLETPWKGGFLISTRVDENGNVYSAGLTEKNIHVVVWRPSEKGSSGL